MDSKNSASWLTYWRNSLADAESLKGIFSKKELEKHQPVLYQALQQGKIDPPSLEMLFKDVDAETQLVSISYYPFAFARPYQHGLLSGSSLPPYVLPIACKLWVHRKGWLLPIAPPLIPRDLLAPQAEDQFVLATVAELDSFFDKQTLSSYAEEDALAALLNIDDKAHQTMWQPFSEAMQQLLNTFAKRSLQQSDYIDTGKSYLQQINEVSNAVRHIISLYDWIKASTKELPLLRSYALSNHDSHQQCMEPLDNISQRSGHSNSQFPLTEAQRAALAQTLAMEDGEILAINGPPGTGKTTFVLSVVASMWVDAALRGKEPPLIVAASTNNQAVTNIIDAFGKDFEETDEPLSGRWLPDISSYGGYLPSKSKESEAAKSYQTSAFYFALEKPEYLLRAKQAFIERASSFYNEHFSNVDDIKNRLHTDLRHRHQILDQLSTSWQWLREITHQCIQVLGADPEAALERQQVNVADAEDKYFQALKEFLQWQEFQANESLVLALFSFLPPVARKRRLQRQLFINRTFNAALLEQISKNSQQDLEQALQEQVATYQQSLTNKQSLLVRSQNMMNEKSEAEQEWQIQVQRIAPDIESTCISDVDNILDTRLRFNLFQLAVHYWEARWLMDCETSADELKNQNPNKPKTGIKSVRPRWLRWMKLTPCVVSTFHSLPGNMTYSQFEGNNLFSTHYLINEIDLLIIDEAGQVAPDVAAASFALAKRALVIGDTHQIKPINQQLPSVDCGNLIAADLISNTEQYNALLNCNQGRDVTTGSVMRIAQQASGYKYLHDAEPGMYLREHRRCYDEIIEYCNTLCYQGLLLPKRGSFQPSINAQTPPMPALGYLHIDGRVESPLSGSRINRLEAKTLAHWLSENREHLETYYKEPLNSLIGVVTPFRAQADLIIEECGKLGISAGRNKDELTVGTVHALQGAERKVVIFSQVYSRHGDGLFIDSDPAMLNVAVSRAKDSFLVFGDMDLLTATQPGTPRHLLGKLIESRVDAELVFAPLMRDDLIPQDTKPKILNDAEEHDSYLMTQLDLVKKEMDMVSPWLSLPCLKNSGLLEAIKAAVARGIEFRLHTDYYFNTHNNNKYDEAKNQRFNDNCDVLRHAGIKVNVVRGVHSKLLMMDDSLLCIGSFNWASAVRDGNYKNMETSFAYQGSLRQEIELQRDYLKNKLQ